MVDVSQRKPSVQKVADIVRDAGGRVVGRTRLQKIGYLLEVAGVGDGFKFDYYHYGPYSEDLATAARSANLLGLLQEEEYSTSWGGQYSVFLIPVAKSEVVNSARTKIAQLAAAVDPVALELAATAAFLSVRGSQDPWKETVKRKPEKKEYLSNAKEFYRELRKIKTPKALPAL
jgi:uncharacterized protein